MAAGWPPALPAIPSAVGIGRADEICPLVFSWDGFWQARPSNQQLRLAAYALRMLAGAAAAYAALPAEQVPRLRRCACMSGTVQGFGVARQAATPHFVRACLVSSAMQLLATRPQYLPAVQNFLACRSSQCRALHAAMLRATDSLFSAAAVSAAAAAGSFACLAPQPGPGMASDCWRGSSGSFAAAGSGSSSPMAAGSGPSSPVLGALGDVLRRVRHELSMRFSPFPSPGKCACSAWRGSACCCASLDLTQTGVLHLGAVAREPRACAWAR